MLCGRQPPLRIDQRAQIFKAIGRHQSGGGKLPERVLNAAGELARVLHDIRQKRGAASAQRIEHLPGRVGQSLPLIGHLPVRAMRAVAAASSSQDASSRRNSAMGADRVGLTRRALPLLPRSRSSNAGCGESAAPDHFTGDAKLIEQVGRIFSDSPAQHVEFPRRRRNFVTLQLLDDVQRAIRTMELRTLLEMLPVIQEPHEVAGIDRLDLASQPPERQPMDTCEHPAIAPLDFTFLVRLQQR